MLGRQARDDDLCVFVVITNYKCQEYCSYQASIINITQLTLPPPTHNTHTRPSVRSPSPELPNPPWLNKISPTPTDV